MPFACTSPPASAAMFCHVSAFAVPPLMLIVVAPVLVFAALNTMRVNATGDEICGIASAMLLTEPVSTAALSNANGAAVMSFTVQNGFVGGSVSVRGASTNVYDLVGSIHSRHSPRKSSTIGFVFDAPPLESV